jgi:signal transduction histidine kinase
MPRLHQEIVSGICGKNSREQKNLKNSENVIMEKSVNTIFIADDSMIDRLILEKTLKKFGFSVKAFENGEAVFKEIITAEEPVLVLLDWLMPGMDGVKVCQALVEDPPNVPVYSIIVTSRTDSNDVAFALDNGADDFIAKPFNNTELRARINVGVRLLTLRQQLIESHKNLLEYTKSMEKLAAERAEQLVRADRLSTIGILSAGMAHEINNPASFVAINIQTLEENIHIINSALGNDTTPEKIESAIKFMSNVPEILQEMKSGMTRIRTIVNGLKTYSHMSHERREWFEIERCIDSALQLCENRLKYRISVITDYKNNRKVYGDSNQIEQVFINLFTNAADAIEEHAKEGKLFITTEFKNGKVLAKVRDSGPGIPDSKIEKVCMPFFTTKPVGKGTGLGLSISSNIINDHKGELLIENHPEGGAVFTIILNGSGEV